MVPFSTDYYIVGRLAKAKTLSIDRSATCLTIRNVGRLVGDPEQSRRAEATFTPIWQVIPTSPWLRRLDRPDPQPKSIKEINPLDSILCRVASRATKRLVNNLFR